VALLNCSLSAKAIGRKSEVAAGVIGFPLRLSRSPVIGVTDLDLDERIGLFEQVEIGLR
jgi:hypothetical protein